MDCYAQKLAALVASSEDVQWALFYIAEDMTEFTVRSNSNDESSQRVPLSKYAGFVASLDPQLQIFIFESILCNEIFWALRRKFYRMLFARVVDPNLDAMEPRYFVENPEYVGEVEDHEAFIRTRLADAISSSGFAADGLFAALQAAASDYQRKFLGKLWFGVASYDSRSAGPFAPAFAPGSHRP